MFKQLCIISVFLFSALLASAQGLFESTSQGAVKNSVQLNGYVRGSAWGLNDGYDYATVFGEFSLRSSYSSGKAFLYSDARIRSGSAFNEDFLVVELKEAFAAYRSAYIDITLGQQIATWGRTDGFNPTNNITPNNYFFLTANPDDQKLSNILLKTDIRLAPQINWELIAIPLFKPSGYRYDLFNYSENVTYADAVLPSSSFENGTFATRLSVELPAVGFSFSWFSGYDPFYGFNVEEVSWANGSPAITNRPSFYKKNSLGFDMAIPVKSLIFRAEIAVNLTDNYKNQMHIPNPDIAAVLALETNMAGFVSIFQYIGKHTIDYETLKEPKLSGAPDQLAMLQFANDQIEYESALFNRKIFHQQEEWNHAVSLTISRSLAHNTLDLELTGFYDITSEESLIRPKIVWNAADALKISVGGQLMSGKDKTVFYHASKIMNGVFLELKTNF